MKAGKSTQFGGNPMRKNFASAFKAEGDPEVKSQTGNLLDILGSYEDYSDEAASQSEWAKKQQRKQLEKKHGDTSGTAETDAAKVARRRESMSDTDWVTGDPKGEGKQAELRSIAAQEERDIDREKRRQAKAKEAYEKRGKVGTEAAVAGMAKEKTRKQEKAAKEASKAASDKAHKAALRKWEATPKRKRDKVPPQRKDY